ncbi:hypothetical protein [Robbsia andropogonis]|uniref:hypothetical protein n=1 Tax=Robbsia andropogonis TaxID=28092 RepID=UPI002A69D5AB|nr:hypothetical protein [Robbsia andropogonis]
MATTYTPTIVTVNTTVTDAPTASQLQQSGALISLGGTTLTEGTYQYCGDMDTLTEIIGTGGNEAEVTKMATSFFAQGSSVGLYVLELGAQSSIEAEISALETWITENSGVFYAYLVPADWDYGSDEVGSVTITSGGSGYTAAPTVTFSAPSSGTAATGTAIIQNGAVTGVTITSPGTGYTAAPTVTFSAPSSGTTATGTASMVSALEVMAANYESPNGKTYFFVTATTANLSLYSGNKAIFALVNSPTAASTEYQAAAAFYQWLVNSPSASNMLAPMAFRYLYSVTPWTLTGNKTTITTILSDYGNVILTGAEGGISKSCLFKGMLADGSQASWWYGIDWFQIQVKQALAAAVINGSNSNPPLLYNQAGINTLLSVIQGIANSAVSFGCAESITVSATSFTDYTTANPSNYKAGIYGGFSATVVGQNGFLSITFNIDATQIA